MKLTICFVSLVCLLLVGQSEQQRPIDWEIAKLQYFQQKLAGIKQALVNQIQFISQVEQALLQAVIDALRRLQNMRTTIRSTGTIQETDEEVQQLFDHCEQLIRKYEQIQREKIAAKKVAADKAAIEKERRLNLAGVGHQEQRF